MLIKNWIELPFLDALKIIFLSKQFRNLTERVKRETIMVSVLETAWSTRCCTAGSDHRFSICYPDSYYSIQEIGSNQIQCCAWETIKKDSLDRRILWSIVSKAAYRSRSTKAGTCCLLNAWRRSFWIRRRTVSVEWNCRYAEQIGREWLMKMTPNTSMNDTLENFWNEIQIWDGTKSGELILR